MATLTTTEEVIKPQVRGTGGSGDGFRDNGGGRGGGGNGRDRHRPTPNKYRIGMWFGIGSILMFFMALTSAYVIREGSDWEPIAMPSVLWLSTGVLLASSFTIEWARRALQRGLSDLFKRWLSVTTFLGAAFLVGQLLAWRQLVAKGIYLAPNPHASFFYLLTSLHGLHLLGGLIALSWIVFGAWRERFAPERRTPVEVTALYWHFMDGLWVYLFLLLFFWR